jgi:hypothetical protein
MADHAKLGRGLCAFDSLTKLDETRHPAVERLEGNLDVLAGRGARVAETQGLQKFFLELGRALARPGHARNRTSAQFSWWMR